MAQPPAADPSGRTFVSFPDFFNVDVPAPNPKGDWAVDSVFDEEAAETRRRGFETVGSLVVEKAGGETGFPTRTGPFAASFPSLE